MWLNTSGGLSFKASRATSMRPRKSGTKVSILMCGFKARISRLQSAKCCAPPSRKSSRSTEVITTYLSFIS
ncbi:Uncharacterised protein [Vibrio cholerae]|nr:Uncharacterised protein [Vibrio cholerae]